MNPSKKIVVSDRRCEDPLAPITPKTASYVSNTRESKWSNPLFECPGKRPRGSHASGAETVGSKLEGVEAEELPGREREVQAAGEWQVVALNPEYDPGTRSATIGVGKHTRKATGKALVDEGECVIQVEAVMESLVADTEDVLNKHDADAAMVLQAKAPKAHRRSEQRAEGSSQASPRTPMGASVDASLWTNMDGMQGTWVPESI
eukprot:jgi/Tetstr1/423013/TSEL_013789.t2